MGGQVGGPPGSGGGYGPGMGPIRPNRDWTPPWRDWREPEQPYQTQPPAPSPVMDQPLPYEPPPPPPPPGGPGRVTQKSGAMGGSQAPGYGGMQVPAYLQNWQQQGPDDEEWRWYINQQQQQQQTPPGAVVTKPGSGPATGPAQTPPPTNPVTQKPGGGTNTISGNPLTEAPSTPSPLTDLNPANPTVTKPGGSGVGGDISQDPQWQMPSTSFPGPTNPVTQKPGGGTNTVVPKPGGGPNQQQVVTKPGGPPPQRTPTTPMRTPTSIGSYQPTAQLGSNTTAGGGSVVNKGTGTAAMAGNTMNTPGNPNYNPYKPIGSVL